MYVSLYWAIHPSLKSHNPPPNSTSLSNTAIILCPTLALGALRAVISCHVKLSLLFIFVKGYKLGQYPFYVNEKRGGELPQSRQKKSLMVSY